MGVSEQYPRSVSAFEIFQRRRCFHLQALRKRECESGIADCGMLPAEFSEMWAVLLGKSYQGAVEFIRAILLKK